MQTIPASEIKRRGLAALEEILQYGPVHIVKRNILACVVLSEQEYQNLVSRAERKINLSLSTLLNKPATGTQSRKQLEKRLQTERSNWDT